MAMNIASILSAFVAAQPAVATTENNGAKGTPIVSDIVSYTSNQGRTANHFVASVQMGKGQWAKDVDQLGNEVLTSKPTLLIQVYPASQKEATHPLPNKEGKIENKKVQPCKATKEKLALIVKALCNATFTLSEYTEKACSENEDLQNVLKELSNLGVAVDKDMKKFMMKTFYLLPTDVEGEYVLKVKGFNPNRRG